MKSQRTHTRTVFISDIHIPYEDKKSLDMAMEIIKDMKLSDKDNIIIGGDLLDYYPLSTFSPALTASNIEIELFEGVEFLNKLRKLAPKSNIFFFEGNHEQRMQKKILACCAALAPFLANRLHMHQILEFKKFKIRNVSTPFTLNKKLFYMHGHEKRGFSTPQHIANVNLKYYNRNIIFGHHHRFDMTLATQLDGSILGGFANGCLADLSRMPGGLYSPFDNTQRGLSVVHEKSNGFFTVNQHIFIPNKNKGYECLVNNKGYSSK